MTKIWIGVFWGKTTEASAMPSARPTSKANRSLMTGAACIAVAGTLTISVLAGGLYELSERAANDLRDHTSYIALTEGPDQ